MDVQEVINILQELAPLAYAEDFDNVGLLVGNKKQKVKGILVTLDSLEAVVDEAVEKKCNLIVSFHPIIFKGLKQLTGSTYVERVVIKAIQHNVAIFAIHTALDNAFIGVNNIICNQLQLKNKQILVPQKNTIKKIQTYVPKPEAENLRQALFSAGAGNIGNYDECSFNVDGKGTYRGNKNSNPTIGKKGILHTEKETLVSVTYEKHIESKLLNTLFNVHPYEEVAYEITALDNENQQIGIGMVGEFEIKKTEIEALRFIQKKMKANVIKHSKLLGKPVKKVAVLGGSGSFAIGAAKKAGADVFVTSDLKYHDFFTAENDIILVDIGHYESEQYIKTFLVEYLSKKIPNFAIILSNVTTNPVKYL